MARLNDSTGIGLDHWEPGAIKALPTVALEELAQERGWRGVAGGMSANESNVILEQLFVRSAACEAAARRGGPEACQTSLEDGGGGVDADGEVLEEAVSAPQRKGAA